MFILNNCHPIIFYFIPRDPLSMHPDVYPQPVFGPSLMIAGRSAKWNGSTNNRLGEIGVSCRVLLEAQVNERVISTLDLHNNGTAVVYYSWKVCFYCSSITAAIKLQRRPF